VLLELRPTTGCDPPIIMRGTTPPNGLVMFEMESVLVELFSTITTGWLTLRVNLKNTPFRSGTWEKKE
jgi:hypothetical protein